MARVRDTLIAKQALGFRTSSAAVVFPVNPRDFLVVIDDIDLLPDVEVRVEVELSWDGGRTWPPGGYGAVTATGGPKTGRNGLRSITFDPWIEPYPTHYRVHIEPVRGFPVAGVRG